MSESQCNQCEWPRLVLGTKALLLEKLPWYRLKDDSRHPDARTVLMILPLVVLSLHPCQIHPHTLQELFLHNHYDFISCVVPWHWRNSYNHWLLQDPLKSWAPYLLQLTYPVFRGTILPELLSPFSVRGCPEWTVLAASVLHGLLFQYCHITHPVMSCLVTLKQCFTV